MGISAPRMNGEIREEEFELKELLSSSNGFVLPDIWTDNPWNKILIFYLPFTFFLVRNLSYRLHTL